MVAAVDGGMSQQQAAARFGVSVNWVGRHMARDSCVPDEDRTGHPVTGAPR
jgi:transposase